MTQENKQERIVILSKGFGVRFEKSFFMQIQEGFDNGYRIADTDLRDDVSMRNFQGRTGRAVMYLEGCEPARFIPATVEPTPVTETPTVKEETKPEDLSTGRAENTPVDESKSEETEKAPTLEAFNALRNVKELKAFAKEHKIEIPVEATTKKLIKEAIEVALKA